MEHCFINFNFINFDLVSLENLVLDQPITNYQLPLIGIFLNSHHFSAQYCIIIVKRNSTLVTDGSERFNRLLGNGTFKPVTAEKKIVQIAF